MRPEQKEDGWWIVDTPEGVDEAGPYPTKAEAQHGITGIKKFLALVASENRDHRVKGHDDNPRATAKRPRANSPAKRHPKKRL